MKKLNKIFNAEQLSQIDRYLTECEGISSIQIIESFASAWVNKLILKLPLDTQIAVVAGNGRNGSEGYAIARMLKKCGKNVTVYQIVTGLEQSVDCEINYKRWLTAKGEVIEIYQPEDFNPPFSALVVDAIYGVGFSGRVWGLTAKVIERINDFYRYIIAVDIPSGMHSEDELTGTEVVIKAMFTFTNQFAKLAFFLAANYPYVGEWEVLHTEIDYSFAEQMKTPWYYTDRESAGTLVPYPNKFQQKWSNGRGLLIAGKPGMMGAAVLAAKAALRSGIGLLFCHVPVKSGDILQITNPEAILDLDVSAEGFTGIDAPLRFDAIAIGPALGKGPEAVAGFKRLLREWRGRTIIDADALTILAEHRELLKLLHDECILTPHVREFERLVGKCGNDFERLNKLSNFVRQYGSYMILKGAHTVVATPDGGFYFNGSGNPGMAKGGMGDVLTGVLLALSANRLSPLDTARIGVYAHGMAGDILLEELSSRGICAGMVAETMPKAWRAMTISE